MSINGYYLFFTYHCKTSKYNKYIPSKILLIEKIHHNNYLLSLQHPFEFNYLLRDLNLEPGMDSINFLLCASKNKHLDMDNKNNHKILVSFKYDPKKIFDCCDTVPMHYFDSKQIFNPNIYYKIFQDVLPYLVIKNIIRFIDIESWIELSIRPKTYGGKKVYYLSRPNIKIPSYILHQYLME